MIHIENLIFAYPGHAPVLNIPTLDIPTGKRVFLHGPSGTGKTTLLGIIAGILTSQTGKVIVGDRDMSALKGSARDLYRGSHIGYIFQMFNLIPYLSVIENITLPLFTNKERMARIGSTSPQQVAEQLAKELGIDHLLQRSVMDLSVGQQQRVACARALIGSPELVIADEPTSALDADHRERFLKLLFAQCTKQKSTLLFVSHDLSLAPLFDDVLSLRTLNSVKVEASAL